MAEITIIADDMTGACDAGAQLLPYGWAAEVLTDCRAYRPGSEKSAVLSLSTDARGIDPAEAERRIASLIKSGAGQTGVVYKKVDSLLRGNVGAECAALLRLLNCDGCIIAPAFPGNGRMVVDGFVQTTLADGTRLKQSALEAVAKTTGEPVALLPLERIAGPREELTGRVGELIRGGARLIVADARTDGDLARIADFILNGPFRLLGAGSAGLMAAYPGAMGMNRVRAPGVTAGAGKRNGVLAVIGSLSPVTIRQLQVLRRRSGVDWVELETERGFDAEGPENPCAKAEKAFAGTAASVRVLTSGRAMDNGAVELSCNLSNEAVAWAYGRTAAMAVARPWVKAVLLSGGDSAGQFMKQAGVASIRLHAEPLPGLVTARAETCGGKRIWIATKSGSFGNENALADLVDYLEKTEEPE